MSRSVQVNGRNLYYVLLLQHLNVSFLFFKLTDYPHVSDLRLQAVCRLLYHGDSEQNVPGLRVRG